MKAWFMEWRGLIVTGLLVIGAVSVLALATIGTVAMVDNNQSTTTVRGILPRATAQATTKATTKTTARATSRPEPTRVRPKRDGGEICKRFGSYAEAKKYYDTHPQDREALSWDGDARPCEDFLYEWR